jgi:predicted DNA-binding transcriptional regulator YafY
MSKRGYISRYLLVLKKLKAKPYCTYEELQSYIERQVDQLQLRDDALNVGFSKRTLQRDLKEIRSLFGIDIEYSKTQGGYFIDKSEMENMNFQRMMESFDVFNSLNVAQGLSQFIHQEAQRPQNTDNLYGLLHAIKNRLQITFTYHKFWEEAPTQRQVSPYMLKEFKSRWYLLANNHADSKVKTFALDRMSALDITQQKFELPLNYDADGLFRHSFGIITPDDEEPQEIILSLTPFQGKYIKTLPLHSSQQILADNKNELRIRLYLYITHDFIMELLSLGDNVKVLQPASLVGAIKAAHKKAYAQY